MCQSDHISDGPSICSTPQDVLAHVVDVHCHPTDSPTDAELLKAVPIHLCAMATRGSDQALVRDFAKAYPDKVTPCFGR